MNPTCPRLVLYLDKGGYAGCDVRLPDDHPARRGGNPMDVLKHAQSQGRPLTHSALVMRLAMHTGMYSMHARLRGAEGHAIVQEAARVGCCRWLRHDAEPMKWGPPRPALLRWLTNDDGTLLPQMVPDASVRFVLPLTPPVYIDPLTHTCGPLDASVPDGLAGEWVEPRLPTNLDAAMEFCRNLAVRFPAATFPVPGNATATEENTVPPVPCLTLLTQPLRKEVNADGAAAVPVVRLSFNYGRAQVHLSSPEAAIVTADKGRLIRCVRNRALEEQAATRLREMGFAPVEEWLSPECVGARCRDWYLRPDAAHDWAGILDSGLPNLTREGWQIDRDRRCRIETIGDEAWYSELDKADKAGWFNFRVGIRVGKRSVNLLPVIQRILAENRARPAEEIRGMLENRQVLVPAGRNGFFLISGSRIFLVLQHLLELFDDAPQDKASAKSLRLDIWRAAEIAQLERLTASPWTRSANLRSLVDRLEQARHLTPTPGPASLQTELRPYQQLGLAWLQFLREAGFGGILADDMGLGKTVQALAHLLLEKAAGRLNKPCLVVAPTSVIQNWADETRRFAPSLKTLVLHGADRHDDFRKMARKDLVITSYALLRRDAEILGKHEFSLVILDEAQYIKNHQALTTQVAGALKAAHRICLTGTPLENHLGELWSLFHFLMPGFLGSEAVFRKRFRDPVERDGSDWVRQFLARRISPFLLRRRKAEVEKDLPPKTIITQGVELSARQRELYESVRLAVEKHIRHEVRARGLNRSQITILDALLKLRQICGDPRLAKTAAARQSSAADSAKLQALMDMLPEMLEEGRKVLLFSQFVGMLSLIEAELTALGIPYALLTGSTRDRPAQIRRFQNGEVGLFLISLKAGGTGINLTAADTVIHYDPWWNPAVENQATDRAHRIGQDKPVFVYRLIAAGTVEARIHAMQERKQKLADGVLREQKADSIRLSMEDLTALLAPLGQE